LIKIKFGSARARNRKLLVLLFAAPLMTGLVLQAACGGGSSGGSHGGSTGTPAGNYTKTVTGTSGSLLRTAIAHGAVIYARFVMTRASIARWWEDWELPCQAEHCAMVVRSAECRCSV
jgi:hypothetical protein